jgi:two-component system osmolarity sensor histidine kinase EnvZ
MMPQDSETRELSADVDEMERMVDGYLAFARGEEGDEPSPFDLGTLVQEIASSFGPHVPVSGPGSLAARGRPLALKRAITNLVSNALKYASHARVTLVNGPHWAEVIVDDDGPGIPPERYEEAFRPFSRLDEARSQNASGSGLGLTLARDTARMHGGDVRLAPSPLGGLRAILRIPH